MKDNTYLDFDHKVTENKRFSFEISTHSEWSWFNVNFHISRKCDHSGIRFVIELIGIGIYSELYDRRHWNYETDSWDVNENGTIAQ